jgi:hypothetical protein
MPMTAERSTRRRALVALLVLAPVPSLGVVAAMVVAPGPLGHGLFLAAKLWLLAFPAAWYVLVERGRPSWSPPRRGGLAAGLLSGIAMAAVIAAAALAAGVRTLDATALRAAAAAMGLGTPAAYLAGAAAWTLANSLVEEYVWRWFVLTQCERLAGATAAVVLSSAFFTAHHVLALSRYLTPGLTLLASAGVFAGGVVWAGLYLRYRSIWPGWLSHVLADVAVFALGWLLLFG